MFRNTVIPVLIITAIIISGCATISPGAGRYQNAEEIAGAAEFEKSYVKSGDFTLTVYSRIDKPGDPVTIYIEGDGLAYRDRSRVSIDPTPVNPIALRLAAVDPSPNVAYIARPGQYCRGEVPDCGEEYWTTKRFSVEIVRSIDETVSNIKGKAGSKEIGLVGFSGGGAIACLVAARRSDVASLRTAAGNLDPDAVNAFNKVDKLEGSLNPIDIAPRLSGIPQRHFAGGKDKIIPLDVTYSFCKKTGDISGKSVTVVPEAEHNKGWVERWPELLNLPLVKPSG